MTTTTIQESPPAFVEKPTILGQASAQWWKRPDDERYLSLESLYAATMARAEHSESQVYDEVAVRCHVPEDQGVTGSELTVKTPRAWGDGVKRLGLTDWSLGQVCREARIPVNTVRTYGEEVPGGTGLMAFAMNQGLQHLSDGGSQVFVRTHGDQGRLMALTGPNYGRIYDHQVVKSIMAATEGGSWKVPAASYQAQNPKRATTLYASDSDVFIFLVDEDHPLEIKTPDGIRSLSRGFFAWNSEVGKTVFGIKTFLYDYVCDNRLVWGAYEMGEVRIRHTSGAPDRFAVEGRKELDNIVNASPARIEAHLEAAAEFKVGSDEEEVVEFLQSRGGYSKKEAGEVMEMARSEEGGAETVWQLTNGATARARRLGHTDKRIEEEERASKLLNAIPKAA